MKDIYYVIIDLLRQMWRFRWWSVALMWMLGLGVAGFIFTLPNIYEARAQFYVDANSRLSEVVRELGMTPSVNSRLFLVQQAMLSRPQLESVAENAGLLTDTETDEEHEALILAMREDLLLDTGRGEEGQNHYTIAYRHPDREKAVRVVELLLSGFVENVLSKKSADTTLASEFLDSQLSHYRSLLTQTEHELQEFKRLNPGFVVDDAGGTFERLQAARSEVSRLERLQAIQRDKRNELRRQLSKVDPYAPGNGGGVAGTELSSMIPGAKTQKAINDLEARKAQLLLSFTPNHPDITSIEQQLTLLREQLQTELATEVADRGPDGAARATNPVYIQIQLTLSAANLELAEVDSQLKNARGNATALNRRLQTAPEIERKFIELTRDYSKYQALYDQVLLQAERERIGRVGDEQDVVTFNEVEPPYAGLQPVSPPRLILLLGGFVLALGAGVAVAFMLDQLKPTFGSEAGLAKLEVQILGSVSMFVSPDISARRRGDLLRFLAATGAFVVVYAAMIVGMEWGVAQINALRG